jgi:hypothetical protein
MEMKRKITLKAATNKDLTLLSAMDSLKFGAKIRGWWQNMKSTSFKFLKSDIPGISC